MADGGGDGGGSTGAASNTAKVGGAVQSAAMLDELPEDLVATAEEQLAKDTSEIPPFWIQKYEKEAARNWHEFYKRHKVLAYKDRHWLLREFPVLAPRGVPQKVIEVGCGVGNTFFPLLEVNPHVFVYAFDFAASAIDIIKGMDEYDETRVQAFVCDIVGDEELPEPVVEAAGTIDAITLLYVLSAIAPENHAAVFERLSDLLAPGGSLLFRDYGRYDLAQLRFKKGRKIDDNFYVRQDGTRSYYFTREEIASYAEAAGLEVESNMYNTKVILNRKRGLEMRRVWVQAVLRKPGGDMRVYSIDDPDVEPFDDGPSEGGSDRGANGDGDGNGNGNGDGDGGGNANGGDDGGNGGDGNGQEATPADTGLPDQS